ncbi:ligase-associated DNA damage response DEXH box helicase [Solitalea canadensis]|uniref:Lhr-like helicase n=1 Tax=Solitalea canadensis (strain ATCC 29591 / DSM 3403 / JCM 21819 / LMG 8368 / NBRC 15130 / NCIMB 12057 / USAM 9D) TaxID=929556 RepID=H8KQ24_SOLCM|nr:ligase-associated DNA damage response DEXH box helicase [Solitalea canadensis]AFD06192.1 Lhr-like helicase [Solitalea canadensis DSM 3403]
MTKGEKIINGWLKSKEWKLAKFQRDSLVAYLQGKNGLVNAPTGSGKTYALFLPVLIQYINENPDYKTKKSSGLQVLWITPLRALTRDLQRNMQLACNELEIPWTVGVRTGDMSSKEKALQKKELPHVLLITPESIHLLFTQKNNSQFFKKLKVVVVDEWHELLSTKRGVQAELALAHLRALQPGVQTWGMSATIGNIEQALQVIIGMHNLVDEAIIIRSDIVKKVAVESVLPDHIEKMPWAGYLGINLLDKVMPIIHESRTTLLFTNTRSQTEIWYRIMMERYPELAGLVALHHGSLDRDLRNWVEENLHLGKLKLVICTSSLDLGVDFRPVETVIQVGSPKSISRFLQRAGRSGHQPGAVSRIYFVPTHSLELIEGASLRVAVKNQVLEERIPIVQAFDVLAQFMVTLAVGDGFEEKNLFKEISSTYSYQYINRNEWEWLLGFITTGSASLLAYDEFKKVEKQDEIYRVTDRRVALRHRLSMGTIVSESSVRIQTLNGKYIGAVEESFITWLKPGDVFSFAGMHLELIRVRDMTAQVRKTVAKKALVPRWAGGRIPLSSQLAAFIRERLDEAIDHSAKEPEMKKLEPLMSLQQERSAIPNHNELLIEECQTTEGFHLFFFPFEGRLVHEGMASLIAYRIGRIRPITFSMAMNDYGFELLSDTKVAIQEILEEHDLFSVDDLLNDIYHSVNANEMARRKFREIAAISGLLFQGYPGRSVKTSHLQASSSLLFEVMRDHEPNNLLLKQAYQESLDQQLEEKRLRQALEKIRQQEVIITYPDRPSPFSFPIMVDRLREEMSSEKLEDRVNKLIEQIEVQSENNNKG